MSLSYLWVKLVPVFTKARVFQTVTRPESRAWIQELFCVKNELRNGSLRFYRDHPNSADVQKLRILSYTLLQNLLSTSRQVYRVCIVPRKIILSRASHWQRISWLPYIEINRNDTASLPHLLKSKIFTRVPNKDLVLILWGSALVIVANSVQLVQSHPARIFRFQNLWVYCTHETITYVLWIHLAQNEIIYWPEEWFTLSRFYPVAPHFWYYKSHKIMQ